MPPEGALIERTPIRIAAQEKHNNVPDAIRPFFHDIINYAVYLSGTRCILFPSDDEALCLPGADPEEIEKTPEENLPEGLEPILESIEKNSLEIINIIKNPQGFPPNPQNAITFLTDEFLPKLKNPIGQLSQAVNSLEGFEEDLTQEQKGQLDLIRTSCEKIIRKIKHPLVVFEIENGTYKGNFEKADFWEISSEASTVLRSKAKEKNVTFQFLDENLESFDIIIDRESFDDLLVNILKNAIEASKKGDKIIISAKKLENGSAELCFHNQGEIPTEIEQHFGEKYVSHGKENGTGLGAYSARLITEFHGGNFRFETSKKDGTYIFITLPGKPPKIK